MTSEGEPYTLQETLKTLSNIFEDPTWTGFSGPHPHLIKMRHGAPSPEEPIFVRQAKSGIYSAPEPSFPFHTETSRKVYAKAVKLLRLYPLDDIHQILKRAMHAVGVIPRVDITPEDEHLLHMAIEWAKDGPVKSTSNRMRGAPGGPFNSDS